VDEIIAEKYRHLMKTGFAHAGEMDQPSDFIDTRAEGISICEQATRDYMNIFVKIENDEIKDLKYLCSCDPTSNVVIEALCNLVIGKTINEARLLTKEDFFQNIGSNGGGVRRKVWGIMELLHRIIYRHENRVPGN